MAQPSGGDLYFSSLRFTSELGINLAVKRFSPRRAAQWSAVSPKRPRTSGLAPASSNLSPTSSAPRLGSDQWCFALAILVKVQIRAGLDKRVNQWQFLAPLHRAVEEHVRNVVERVREAFLLIAPFDEFISARRIFGQELQQSVRISASDCFIQIHAALILQNLVPLLSISIPLLAGRDNKSARTPFPSRGVMATQWRRQPVDARSRNEAPTASTRLRHARWIARARDLSLGR